MPEAKPQLSAPQLWGLEVWLPFPGPGFLSLVLASFLVEQSNPFLPWGGRVSSASSSLSLNLEAVFGDGESSSLVGAVLARSCCSVSHRLPGAAWFERSRARAWALSCFQLSATL